MLELRLFGPLRVAWHGTPLEPPTRRRTAMLLAFLAIRDGEVGREHAAFTLWPDMAESEARAELRRHLYFLARWLEQATGRGGWLARGRARIAWNADPESWVDVRAFRDVHLSLVAGRPGDAPRDAAQREALTRAAALYEDDLLPSAYDRWLHPVRERLRRQLLETLDTLATAEAAAGDHESAARTARRLVERDPLREESHRQLIRYLAASGDRASALAQYERCRRTLHAELDVQPAPETEALARGLKTAANEGAGAGAGVSADGSPAPHGRVAEPSSPQGSPQGSSSHAPRQPCPAVPDRVPRWTTRFFGREQELAALHDHLRSERLVCITGPGGVGKTRFAAEFARAEAEVRSGGVAWVDLLGAPGSTPISDVVLGSLRAESAGMPTGSAALSAALAQRAMLIVLDNAEQQIFDVAAFAETLLETVPDVRLLVTSREPLRCASESVWALDPLTGPTVGTEDRHEPSPDSAAVALFVDRAGRRARDWDRQGVDRRLVATVCARLDGLPLAIEMAAARVDSLSVATMAARLGDDLELFGQGLRTAPSRQRTLRATYRWSEGLLTPAASALLQRLAPFVGSFDLAAAEAVGAGLDEDSDGDRAVAGNAIIVEALTQLVDASLVQPARDTDAPRYRILETIRPFAREQAIAAGTWPAAADAHARYVLHTVETSAPLLDGPDYRSAVRCVDRLSADLRRAADHLLASGQHEQALRLAAGSWRFWNLRMAFGDERDWLERLVAATPDADPALRAPALLGAGVLAYGAGQLAEADDLIVDALEQFEQLPDPEPATTARAHLALVRHRRGDDVSAAALCELSLSRHDERGARGEAAEVLTILGGIALRAGDLPSARTYFERSLASQRHLRWQHHGLRNALRGLGAVALGEGRPEEAGRCFEEGLELSRELGDRGGEAVWLNELGCIHMDRGRLDEAQSRFRDALGIYQAQGDGLRQAIILHNLGEVSLLRGAHGIARLAFERSLQSAGRKPDDPRRVESLIYLVVACAMQGDLRRAEELQAEAIELARRTDDAGLRAFAARAAALSAHRAEASGPSAEIADRRTAVACEAARAAGGDSVGPALELALWRSVERGDHTTASQVAAAWRALNSDAPRYPEDVAQTEDGLRWAEGGSEGPLPPFDSDPTAALTRAALSLRSKDEPMANDDRGEDG